MSSRTLDAIGAARTSRSTHSRLTVATVALSAALALTVISIAIAAEVTMVPPEQLQKIVEVRDVRAQPDQVTGVLVNLSSKPVRSIQIRVSSSWLWTDERHPGDEADDPGHSVVYTLPGEIAPGGRLPFTYRPDAPLPERRNGRFETSVSVLGLEQVG
jgi:uncharacterized membrane protein